ncbi:hypothetical protein [Candidatus Aalborgicola defluviihabitans]|uniref:hypothetical protein n=1 Tax=Candidatus Aalborgicola defluviihabitans TaxID=3386187 RepID=UPI001D37E3BC|nr:hypothetical protein [Burkholderiales bacterium]
MTGYQQLAFVSSVLAGFAFAFYGTLLISQSTRRIGSWTALLAACAGICFLIFTLGSTFSVTVTLNTATLPEALRAQQEPLTTLFLLGIVLTLFSFGIGGWMRSHKLGVATICVALMGLVGVLWVMQPFIHRN